MGRTLLAGLLGAIAMFIWSAVAHTALPLGELGVQTLTDEPAVLAAMQAGTGDKDGMYMFPGASGGAGDHSAKAMEETVAKTRTGPSGTLIYHPAGRATDMGPYLIVEFALELVQSLVIALVVAGAGAATFGGRVTVAALIGVAVSIASNGSYWNWYGFPTSYTLGAVTAQFVGYVLAGLVIALVLGLKPRPAAD